MSRYFILYHPRVKKQIKRLHKKDQGRIFLQLNKLANDPYADVLDVKKLVNTMSFYRLRVGQMRVIFEFDNKKQAIYVWKVDYRGSVY